MSEVSDAIQVVVVSGRAMYRVGSTSVRAAAAMIKLFNTISLSKWKGKTSLGHLRQIKGDDMVFINIASEEGRILRAFEKEMRAHGILYARMPDLCGGDGRTQYAIGASDISKVKPLLLDHSVGRYREVSAGLISEQDYLGSGIMPDGTATMELTSLSENGRARAEGRQPARQQQGTSAPAREAVRVEGNTDILKIHELVVEGGKDDFLFIDHKPVLTEESFAVYSLPDGLSGIVVEQPKGYKILGHQTALFADRQYHLVDFGTGQISQIKGDQAIPIMKGESIMERNSALKSLAKEKRMQLAHAITEKLTEMVR